MSNNIDIWVPGRPSSYKENFINRPMQDIDLMQYQGLIKRSAKVVYLETRLPLNSEMSIDITFNTAQVLDIIAATKPVLNALKGEVFLDDDLVRSLMVNIDNEGPADTVQIAIAQERSVAGEQPYKTLSYMRRIDIRATPRMDQPPHSKLGETVTISDESSKRAMTAIREYIDPGIEPLDGEIMVSMKIKTRDRKLDLDNTAHLYVAACQGLIFREKAQIKHLYMTFMNTKIFPGDEGVYMTFEAYT